MGWDVPVIASSACADRAASVTPAVQELLEHGEPLCLPPTQDGVRHAVGLEAEEELEVLLRQIHVHLEMFEPRRRRHRISVPPDDAAIPVVEGSSAQNSR